MEEKMEKVINITKKLIKELYKIQQVGDGEKINNAAAEFMAERVIGGTKLWVLIESLRTEVYLSLIRRGYSDNVKLAEVLGEEDPISVKKDLFCRGIKIIEIWQPKKS